MSLMLERDVDILSTPPRDAKTRLRIIDCDIQPYLRTPRDLDPLLSARWRQHLTEYGKGTRGIYAARGTYPRFMPNTCRRDAWPAGGGLPGSDVAASLSLERFDWVIGGKTGFVCGHTCDCFSNPRRRGTAPRAACSTVYTLLGAPTRAAPPRRCPTTALWFHGALGQRREPSRARTQSLKSARVVAPAGGPFPRAFTLSLEVPRAQFGLMRPDAG